MIEVCPDGTNKTLTLIGLDTGPAGVSGNTARELHKETIESNEIKTIDFIIDKKYRYVKYLVTIRTTDDRFSYIELYIQNRDSDIQHTNYYFGDDIEFLMSMYINRKQNIEIEIENHEEYLITFEIMKMFAISKEDTRHIYFRETVLFPQRLVYHDPSQIQDINGFETTHVSMFDVETINHHDFDTTVNFNIQTTPIIVPYTGREVKIVLDVIYSITGELCHKQPLFLMCCTRIPLMIAEANISTGDVLLDDIGSDIRIPLMIAEAEDITGTFDEFEVSGSISKELCVEPIEEYGEIFEFVLEFSIVTHCFMNIVNTYNSSFDSFVIDNQQKCPKIGWNNNCYGCSGD